MPPDRPRNVVCITTDQQRADLAAREDYPLDPIPFLDRLAGAGTWFDRAYTPIPVCGPARVSLLTGRYPTATGVWENGHTGHARYTRDLFEVMNDAGFRTAMVGKNHSHLTAERTDYWCPMGHRSGEEMAPADAAFDEWMSEDLDHGPAREPTPFPLERQLCHRAVTGATTWLESLAAEPFFLWLSFPEPHNPYQVPEPYYSMFPPAELPPVTVGPDGLADKPFEWRWARHVCERRSAQRYPDRDWDELVARMRSNYLGMLRMLDDQVRRFVETLDRLGRREDTLLIVTADHGDFVGDYGLMRKGPGLPEVTTRVPLQFAGPGVASTPGAHDAHVSLVDLYPTICEAMDLAVPSGVQGRSLWPLLTDPGDVNVDRTSVYAEAGIGGPRVDDSDRPTLDSHPGGHPYDELNPVTQAGRRCMVRRGDWKLTWEADGEAAIYDLARDSLEETNRIDAAEAPTKELMATLLSWQLRVRDPLPESTYATRDA